MEIKINNILSAKRGLELGTRPKTKAKINNVILDKTKKTRLSNLFTLPEPFTEIYLNQLGKNNINYFDDSLRGVSFFSSINFTPSSFMLFFDFSCKES